MNVMNEKELLNQQSFYFIHLQLGFGEELFNEVLKILPDAKDRADFPYTDNKELTPATPEQGESITRALIVYDAELVYSGVLPAFTPFQEEWRDALTPEQAVNYQVRQIRQVIQLFTEMTNHTAQDVTDVLNDWFNYPDIFDFITNQEDATPPTEILTLEEASAFITKLQTTLDSKAQKLLYIITAYEE